MNFSIFDINRTLLSENNDLDASRRGIESDRTAIRNKLAFFKPKSILIRNNDIEIGYKRSPLTTNSNSCRVILFFNNKTADYKIIRTEYKYEQDYYEVNVT